MQIDVTAETARIVHEELNSGRFRSVDEFLQAAVDAWRERNANTPSNAEAPLHADANNLSDLLLNSPFHGANLNLERVQDYPRPIDIE